MGITTISSLSRGFVVFQFSAGIISPLMEIFIFSETNL
jgi:hypothetical protein